MKKNGFVLVETLIATTLIAVVFTIIYIEFGVINNNYKKTYNNNTVDKVYAVNNIKNFVLVDNYETISNSPSYVDITNCEVFTNTSQCQNLIKTLNVDTAIYFPAESNILRDYLENSDKQDIIDYIKAYIPYELIDKLDILLVRFNDGQITSLEMKTRLGTIEKQWQ